ncbi:uncharacterized protein LOC106639996 [Copidosoma floridanum]|uniref:uncharacterized protein LOC106639996 n=1 Tax=Copidosoma floridanum TaxID=29053 RepID=UPI0006C96FA3|nr:uncharacterized protein LOC106639996 [Copidosoma floridanum]
MFSHEGVICLALIVVASSINGAFGFKCYQCSEEGNVNGTCRSFSNLTATECDNQSFENRYRKTYFPNAAEIPLTEKITTWACISGVSKVGEKEFYVRSCAPKAPKDIICKSLEDNNDPPLHCCDEPACNSSFKINAGLLTLGACLMFINLFWK